jgi:NADP-dependent 3-hydroxy acid dehydrogenase YdfG
MNIKGKAAIVTGSSKGIGLAVCKHLLEKGCKVYGLSRSESAITHPLYTSVSCDVRDIHQVEQCIQRVKSETDAIDILINNAGLGYFGMLEDITLSQWDEMMQTNLNSIFYTLKNVLPLMKQQQSGHIINIASTAALEGMPQVAAYCASKWAVKGLSESLYREVRDFRIKVTCVYPGSVKTDFFRHSPGIQPHDYMLMPHDVALTIIQALEMPDNFHTVNLEIRPLQPKGPSKK